MNPYLLSHLSDGSLLSGLKTLVARDCKTTAELLAHLAEVDQRKLYLPAAYPSMYAYCLGELHLCEQAAFKRIRAARTARQFPAVFDAVAAGRLHLSAVVLLTPYLTPENAEELIAAVTHKSKSEVERLLAARFPLADLPALVVCNSVPTPTVQLSPGTVETHGPGEPQEPRVTGEPHGRDELQLSPGTVQPPLSPQRADDRPRVKPLSAKTFAVRFTMSQAAHG